MRKAFLLSALAAVLLLCAGHKTVAAPAQGEVFAALSAQERQWLEENRDSIVLTYEANFPPLELRTGEGEYVGFSADIVGRLETLLGVRFKKVPSYNVNEQLASLQSGETHLCAAIVRTPEHERFAFFTGPYISLPLVIITTSKSLSGHIGWDELRKKRVGVASGFAAEALVREKARGRFTVVPVGSVREGLRDVSFGVLDAFVENLASASYYIEKDALTNLRVAGATDHSYHISIAVGRQYPLLYSAVQKALSEISGGDMEASRKKWISLSGGGVLSPEAWRLVKLAGVFTVLLLLSLGAVTYYLRRRLSEKVASLRLAQQELLEQTERLGLATEATNAGVWDFYPDTGQAYFSEQWIAMLGYEPGAVEANFAGWVGLIHPEDRVNADNALMGYVDTGGEGLFEGEYRVRQADGSYRWMLGKGRAIAWDQSGIPTRLVGLNLDIQKLKTVQEELRQSEALAQAAFDQTFQLCGLLTTDGLVVNINRKGLVFAGVSREEIVGRPFWDCPWWPDRLEAEGLMRLAMATVLAGGTFRREVLNVDAQGSRTVLDFSLSPLIGAGGGVEFFIVEGRDVTEMRQAEAALKESEEKFRAIFNNSPVGIFRTTFDGRLLEANTALARMHGCGSVAEYLFWARDLGKDRYAHPEDRQRLLDALLENPSGASLSTELRRRDGSTCQGVITAVLHLDEHGAPTLIDGTIEDITERKQAEQDLANAKSILEAAFEQNPAPMVLVTMPDGIIRIVNQACREFLGIEDEPSSVGLPLGEAHWSWQDYTPDGRPVPKADIPLVRAMAGETTKNELYLVVRKDGQTRWSLDCAAPIHGADGRIIAAFMAFPDITERKQAEEALLEEKRFTETLLDGLPNIFFLYDANLRLRRWNRNHETSMGFSAEELLGRDIGEWFGTEERRSRGIESARKILFEARQGEHENYLLHKDGHEIPYILTGVRLDTAEGPMLMGVGVDITERKSLELRLADQLAFQQALMDTIPYPVFYKGADTRFVGFNKAYEEVFGVRREDLIGKRVLDLEYLPAEDRETYQFEDEAVIACVGQVQRDKPFLYADGAVHQTLYSVTGFRLADGTSGGLIGVIVDITDRVQAEEALRQSEEKFSRIFEMAPEWISFVRLGDSLFIDVNAAFVSITGFSRAEAIGRTPSDLNIWHDPARRHEFLRRLQADGLVKDFDFMLRRKDGALRHMRAAAQLVDIVGEPSIVGVFHDITERVQAEEALRQSEEKFSRIFEMAPECISFVRLKDSMRIAANAAFETITGYPKEEAVGKSAQELCIWDDPQRRGEYIARLMAEGHVKDFEFLLRRKDGAVRHVVSSAQLVLIAGEQCYVSVIHDITDERRMQEMLIQSEKMMSVGSLAAGIAHEINNPLGIVHQAVQNLILRTSPEQKKNLETAAGLGLDMDKLQAYLKARKLDLFLQDIQAAALRASGIIRNMLNFSRRSESTRQTCDLHRIIEQSVFLASSDYDLKKAYDFKRIEIVQDFEAELPACRCTETELEQVLLNLLRNAAQAMAMADQPTSAPRIEIRLRAGEDCVRLEVADNGPGMDPETQRKALEPFFTTKPPGVGTGLGLSVSYFIITKGHGGRMWLTSAPGRGTTFFIELPADEQEP